MRTAPLLALVLLAGVVSAQRDARRDRRPATAESVTIDAAFAERFGWRELGPANMGGRITDIEVHPQDPSTYWVATASAGLLKTTNNGTTFTHQFDREATVAVGALAVAPSNPDVVWVGTGENNPRNSVSYGDGVYKSVDGGASWQHMGLRESFQIGDIVVHPSDENVVFVGALGRLYGPNEERGLYVTRDGGEKWERVLWVDEETGVIDIAMHPTDPDVMLVATYERQRDGFDTNDPAKKWGDGSAVWRTTDGGRSFARVTEGLPTVQLGRVGFDWYAADPDTVFAIVESELIGKLGEDVGWAGIEAADAETGARVGEVAKESPAAAVGLQKDDIVLAVGGVTVLSNRRLLEELALYGPGDEVDLEYARGGESKLVTLKLSTRPEPKDEEVDESDPRARRMAEMRRERAERPFGTRLGGQNPNVHRMQGASGFQHGGVYRSDDAGKTWRRINSINPRPMYFSQVRVDPSDEQWLFVLGVSMAKSADGGETFTSDAGPGVHADQHALWIDPADGRHMMVGCDGGLYVTYDRGAHWDHLNHAALGQFYHVALGPRRDYWVYGGLQDNGTWGAPHRSDRGSGVVNEEWLRIGGGDGFVVQVDAEDPDQIYYESQNGGTARTHLGTQDGGRIAPRAPEGVRYRFNWKTPFLLSAHNSRIYYSAGNHVFRSLNRGDDLVAISPEITRGERGSATALAESPRDAAVLYVGTDDGALWGTRDGGHTWQNLWQEPAAVGAEPGANGAQGGPRVAVPTGGESVPLGELVEPRWVSSIEASRFATGRAFLTLDGHRSDDDAPHVFVTDDHGATWRSLAANLPRGSTRVVREDLHNENLLYLGTEFGLWVSLDRGASWTRFHGALPTVAVHEVAQHPGCGDVVLATHGRSLWAVDVTALRQMTAATLGAAAHLFEPAEVVNWRSKHRRARSGARAFAGDNPAVRAELFVHLGSRARSVAMQILDAGGEVVRELEVPREQGLHRVDWDLRATPREDEGGGGFRGGFRGGRFRGRTVEPGSYRAVLTVDGERVERELRVVGDPEDGPGR